MFRILLIIGLLFASAAQGFAHKVDVAVEDTSVLTAVNKVSGNLVTSECCEENAAVTSKTSHCISDCKGVIGTARIEPLTAAQVPDGTSVLACRSIITPLEPGPPKS